MDDNGNSVGEITNNDPVVLETKIRVESFHPEMELSLSLQHKLKGRIFTINTPLRSVMTTGESEKTIRLEIPANFIAPNHYSWISSIHIPGKHLNDVLWDECQFSIKDMGTEFARYEGVDYGCVILDRYNLYALEN